MSTFIEDYLRDSSQAIAEARDRASRKFWYDDFSEEEIYKEIASPEYHLYETVVLCENEEITPHASGFAVVA